MTQTVKLGSRGEAVKAIQKALNLYPDGIFGPLTDEAVKKFQKEHGLTPDGVVGPKTYEKLGISSKPKAREITEIIVHCSATPEGKDFTVADIKRWHLQRNFSDIGYHWVIYRDGSVHPGRNEAISGAHCTGHNSNSIGVCYIGGVAADGRTPRDTRTEAQKQALLKTLKSLKMKYPKAKIYSHRDFANKACPSFDATREYRNI
jgi:N-acetylmuramoyl-L-alanine amidase